MPVNADPRLRGLYVITDAVLCEPRGLEACVAAALAGGARLVQYRDKSDDHVRRRREAAALRAICEAHHATFIVNDDVSLAAHAAAHGVHLGRDDADVSRARALLGETAIVGVSCYDDFERARRAQQQGADYVAFGSVFASSIKPEAVRAPLALFERARNELDVPACAIGGVHRGNIHLLAEAGAAMAAVISAVFSADDIESAARELNAAFSR